MNTKQIQGKLWSTAPANWSAHFEPFFLPMYKKALEQIQLRKNMLLLDAGCGSGLFSHMAASAGAQVVGIDAAPGLLELARKRNPGITFLEGDLESLPFVNSSFDIVTGFNSFHYAGNLANALTEAKRVLKVGGKLVIGMWDKPYYCDATSVLKAILSLLPQSQEDIPVPFTPTQDGLVELACETIGLKIIYRSKVSCPFLYHSTENAIMSFLCTAPAAAAMDHVSEKVVRHVIGAAMQPFHLTEDMYHLQNSFLLLVVTR